MAQQEADRRTGGLLVSLLDQAGKAEVDDLLAYGEVIPAIKRVRELTGLRLIDAKRLVESLRDGGDVAAKRPWWQIARTARQGFRLGALNLFLGVFELVLIATGNIGSSLHWLNSVVTVLFLVIGIACMASAVVLRQRERSGLSPSAQGGSASAPPRG